MPRHNWDLVGNNIPVFFIQDAMKFPDLVHALKPEPNNAMPQAASAHDTFWDFVSLMPEKKIVTRRGAGDAVAEQQADASHGGFDNNVEMVATTLRRITGAAQLALPVDDLVGF